MKTEHELNMSRRFDGQWHLFGDDQPPAIGTLEYDRQTGLALNVQCFGVRQQFRAFGAPFEAPPIIRGSEAHGIPITLFGCTTMSNRHSGALEEIKIGALGGFLGTHYTQSEEVKFVIANFSYFPLDGWAVRSALVHEVDAEGFSRFSLHPPPDISAELTDGTRIIITTTCSQSGGWQSVTLEHTSFVQFQFTEPKLARRIANDYALILQNFFSFVTGVNVKVGEIKVSETSDQKREIEWLHWTPGTGALKSEFHPHTARIQFCEIAENLPNLITRWFEYYSKMEPVLNHYFTVVSNHHLPISTRFLLLAQALETYHGRTARFDSALQSHEAFCARRDALIAAVSTADQGWLKEKLHHANQKSLAARLDDLIRDKSAPLAQFVTDSRLFADTIRWTRNYYTHFAEDEEDRTDRGEGRIAQGVDLILYTMRMRALLELLIIGDMEFPESAAARVVANARQARVIRSY